MERKESPPAANFFIKAQGNKSLLVLFLFVLLFVSVMIWNQKTMEKKLSDTSGEINRKDYNTKRLHKKLCLVQIKVRRIAMTWEKFLRFRAYEFYQWSRPRTRQECAVRQLWLDIKIFTFSIERSLLVMVYYATMYIGMYEEVPGNCHCRIDLGLRIWKQASMEIFRLLSTQKTLLFAGILNSAEEQT